MYSAVSNAAEPRKRGTEVVVDGLVLLKMMKHVRLEGTSQAAFGTLLGFSSGGAYEITNCFAQKQNETSSAANNFAVSMIKTLPATIDNVIVGWYTSVFLGAYFTKKIVENHAEHQASKPETILLAFDPAPTAQGLLSLKALRLTDTFMDEWRNQTRHGSEAFTRLAPSSIFESLPVKIRNSHLIQLFMADLIDNKALQSPLALRPAAALTSGLEKQHASTSSTISSSVGHAVGSTAAGVAAAELETDFARLDLATAPFLEKHMEEISQLTDDFLDMQNSKKFLDKDIQANMAQLNDWLANRRAENDRRRAEGQEILPEFDASLPFFKAVTDKSGRDSLDTCLLSAQVTAYCQSVSRFTDTTFGKLFLAAALQK